LELRKVLAEQKDVTFNDDAHYNGETINKDELLEYYAKDLFYFMLSNIQCSSPHSRNGHKFFHVAPIGYDPKKASLANIDYRIKEYGSNDNMLSWRKNAEEEKIICKGLDILY